MLFFKHTILIFFIFSQHLLLAATIETPKFEVPSQVNSNSGYIRLEWSSPSGGNVIYELEEAPSAEFSNPQRIYEGPDLASFISGLPNGTYHYRVRAVNQSEETTSAWSEPVQLTVEHHPVSLALTLAALGALVFLLTAFVVIKGVRTQKTAKL